MLHRETMTASSAIQMKVGKLSLQESGIQNGFREQQLLSHPFFTWEQASVSHVPPLLDAYGNTATSLHAFHVAPRNGVESVYNTSTSYSTDHPHSASSNCYCLGNIVSKKRWVVIMLSISFSTSKL